MHHYDFPARSQIQTLLHQHEARTALALHGYELSPLTHIGSGGHDLFQLKLVKDDSTVTAGDKYILKRWSAANRNSQMFGITQSLEETAHRTGLFASMPASIHVPIVAALPDQSDLGCWILMTDVSTELDQYGRPNRIPVGQLKQKLSVVLDCLAKMHVSFESSAQLEQAIQLGRYNDSAAYVSKDAGVFRHALSKGATGELIGGRTMDAAFVAQINAFLDWLSPSLRPIWEHILVDRSSLIAVVDALPRTILHGDMDDRNIGLPVGGATENTRLTLVDWEWICTGPGGLDAAKPVHQFIGGVPLDAASLRRYMDSLSSWGNEYLHYYRQHGGIKASDDEILTGYHLGLIMEALTPFPWLVGGVLLAQAQNVQSVDVAPGLEAERAAYDHLLKWAEEMVPYVSDHLRMYVDR